MFLESIMWAQLLALQAASAATGPQPLAPAVEEGRPIVIGQSYQLRSLLLGDTRTINVRLPDHYAASGRTFPVIFLLDGGEHEDFLHISGLAQINSAYCQGQEMIVVGIEGVDRRHDLTSPSSVAADRSMAPTSGGAALYRKFLVRELQPWVAERYRTNGRTALMGESLAGLFVLETFLEQPRSFSDYIAISPSLWWNGGSLAANAARRLRRGDYRGHRVRIAFDRPAPPAPVAAREEAQQRELEGAFRKSGPAGLSWTAVHSSESHARIYHPAALAAFRALFGKADC